MPERSEVVCLTVPRDTYYLGIIRRMIADLAERAGFSHLEVGKIEMAVDEACTNAVLHGKKGVEDGSPLHLRAEIGKRGISVELLYAGTPFSFDSMGKDPLSRYLENPDPGGLGIYIIRQFMDEVSYRYRPETGNELRLIKYLESWQDYTS